MNYLKYTSLFVAIFFVILLFLGVTISGDSDTVIAVIAVIALAVATTVVSVMIIKSNNRVMTLIEIIKYVLSFSIVTAMTMIVAVFIFITIGLTTNPNLQSFGNYIFAFCNVVIVILLLALIPMFLINIYFKIKYKNG